MNRFKVRISENDYVESRLELIRVHEKKNRTKLGKIVYSILGYAGLYTFMIVYFEDDIMSISRVYLMIAITFFLYTQYMRMRFKRGRKRTIAQEYRSNKIIKEEASVYFDEGRIEINSISNSIRLEWLDIIGAIKTKSYIILISPNNQEVLLPLETLGDCYKEIKEILKKVKKVKKNWIDDYRIPTKYNTMVFKLGRKRKNEIE